jgi:hypothetical protein
MRGAASSVVSALLLAGCGQEMAMTGDSPGAPAEASAAVADPVGIRPIPPIPLALRGCWVPIPPDDPDEPHGSNRLYVGATMVTQAAGGGEPERVATADFVTRVSATLIEGRWSYRSDGGGTLATALSTAPDNAGTAPGTLRRAEGDAGSVHYRRCAP